ncbi:unnamed protein product [Meloidogyne enterolobii]|uniref:Uncharacterized protein n=1 Tax=Meloidogyne enterolobii TaxID=390850 RepID=A0ACB1ATD2_MELEN
MVMVSDVDLLKKYFIRNGDVFSGRWQNFITHMFMDGHNGIIQIQGDKWREQRRFSLHVLRDFGFGRTAMEEKIKVLEGVIFGSCPDYSSNQPLCVQYMLQSTRFYV